MKFTTTAKTAVAAAGIAVIAISTAGPAAAKTATGKFGQWGWIRDPYGIETAWKIDNLQPSSDTIPNYPLTGKLWEATAWVKARQGSVTPIIPDLNGRTDSGVNYQVLWQAYTPTGISGATLAEGQSATGKVYFDVTDGNPTRVAYYDGVEDKLVWQK